MPVRTLQLGSAELAAGSGDTVLFTCPTGKTAIVKHVAMMTGSTAPTLFSIIARRTGVASVAFHRLTGGVNVAVSVECWVVLEPGDQLVANIQGTGAAGQVWSSGTLLDGVV